MRRGATLIDPATAGSPLQPSRGQRPARRRHLAGGIGDPCAAGLHRPGSLRGAKILFPLIGRWQMELRLLYGPHGRPSSGGGPPQASKSEASCCLLMMAFVRGGDVSRVVRPSRILPLALVAILLPACRTSVPKGASPRAHPAVQDFLSRHMRITSAFSTALPQAETGSPLFDAIDFLTGSEGWAASHLALPERGGTPTPTIWRTSDGGARWTTWIPLWTGSRRPLSSCGSTSSPRASRTTWPAWTAHFPRTADLLPRLVRPEVDRRRQRSSLPPHWEQAACLSCVARSLTVAT